MHQIIETNYYREKMRNYKTHPLLHPVFLYSCSLNFYHVHSFSVDSDFHSTKRWSSSPTWVPLRCGVRSCYRPWRVWALGRMPRRSRSCWGFARTTFWTRSGTRKGPAFPVPWPKDAEGLGDWGRAKDWSRRLAEETECWWDASGYKMS